MDVGDEFARRGDRSAAFRGEAQSNDGVAEHSGAGRSAKKALLLVELRVMGVDEAYPLIGGKKQPVLIALDLGNRQPVAIGPVDEDNPQAVRRFLEPPVKRLGVSVIVTDDLTIFRIMAEKLGLEHQVCQPILDELFRIPRAALGWLDAAPDEVPFLIRKA